ncbi:MAG TPA: ABC transporter permease [Solirubrobacterales bacterium]|nr:ABC transporter permease [Solirubrobacterales bacterium]
MARFILRRLAGMVLVLFAISLIVFAIFVVIPSYDPAEAIAGKNSNPQLVANVEETWGFDEPLPVQYLTMMKLAFSGELVSYSSEANVTEQIWEGLPATFSLCIGAAVIWLLLGLLLGYIAAVHAGRPADRVLTVLAVIGISMPVVLLAPACLYFLAIQTDLFPTGGYVPLSEDPLEWAYHLVLPWTSLAILFAGFYSRVLRSNMLEAMEEDHVRTARAKGLTERQVVTRHVLRNSLIPIVTLFGLDFAAALAGAAIVTESVFNLQGVGQYAADSIANLDLPPIMGVTLLGAFFVVLFNTLVDLAYAYLDPRIRLGESAR